MEPEKLPGLSRNRSPFFPNGKVHSGCRDPTQATARLDIVLASRKLKSGTADKNFVEWKGAFRSDRPKWAERSKWSTFKGDTKSVPVELNRNGPFHLISNWNLLEFWAEWKAPLEYWSLHSCRRSLLPLKCQPLPQLYYSPLAHHITLIPLSFSV